MWVCVCERVRVSLCSLVDDRQQGLFVCAGGWDVGRVPLRPVWRLAVRVRVRDQRLALVSILSCGTKKRSNPPGAENASHACLTNYSLHSVLIASYSYTKLRFVIQAVHHVGRVWVTPGFLLNAGHPVFELVSLLQTQLACLLIYLLTFLTNKMFPFWTHCNIHTTYDRKNRTIKTAES